MNKTIDKREVLFRGKIVDEKNEWVIGDGIHYPKSLNYKGTCWIDGMGKRANDWIPVIPETVGMYVGLRDDKRTEEYPEGQRMFEGDIVTGLFSSGMSIYAVVSFQDGAFGLEWYSGSVKRFTTFTSICNVSYETIGNIFDNPDLIRKDN